MYPKVRLDSRERERERESKRLRRFVKFLFSFFLFTTFFFTIHSSVYAAYITNPPNEIFLQWKLDDNAANTTVAGNEVNGELVGGNTTDIVSIVNGYPAFHLNGSSQYVQVYHRNIWPNEVANLWTKYSGNPVLSDNPNTISFGQLAKNPAGGWYFFGAYKVGSNYSNISRWESSDLITWTNRTEVLAAGGAGAWDADLQVASAFQKPSDGTWIMLYRGFDGANYKIGKATSSDGTNFIRKDNGGVDDGLFPQFGNNFDPVGIILVNDTYYVYVNGSPGHSVENIYTSTDDFATFTANPSNPLFQNAFCGSVWNYGGYYYMLIVRDFNQTGSTLYDHGIALYRSTSPTFDVNNTDFLGYVIVNDSNYDSGYLDTPSVPMTDVYRTTYAPEFGNTLYVLYDSSFTRQSLAYTTFEELANRQPVTTYSGKKAYSFWVQFDSLTNGDPIFSVGRTPTDGAPVWLGVVRTSGADKVFSLFLGGDYRLTSLALTINTPYQVTIVDSLTDKKVYINNALVGTFTQGNPDPGAYYLYIGKGYGTRFLDGYVWDFREYPKDLTSTEVDKLYTTGSIDITGPTISSVSSTTASTGSIVTWTTNENSSTKVDYGLDTSYGSTTSETDTGSGVTSHAVSLSNLSSCTVYYYRVRSKDAVLNETVGSDNNFKTLGCPSAPSSCNDTTPGAKAPWLYDALSESKDSIRVYFTDAQDPVDKYVLEYGTEPGVYQFSSTNIGGKGTKTYLVEYLSPGKTYYFRVRGGNGCATGSWSNEISAKTKSLAPSITEEKEEMEKLKPGEEEEISKEERLMEETPEAAKPEKIPLAGVLERLSTFLKTTGTGIGNFVGNVFRYTKETIASGYKTLAQGIKKPKEFMGRYTEWISYSVISFREIVLDKEPTKISNVKVEKLTPTSAVIFWKTNHLSDSKVNWGETLDYGDTFQKDEKTHEHRIEITNLEPERKYFYEVMSQNKNYVYDANHEFTTPKDE